MKTAGCTCRHGYHRWSEEEREYVLARPDWSSFELARELPGRTPRAIQQLRYRYGRYGGDKTRLCSVCMSRVVWADSPKALRMGLCEGCYLDEMRQRMKERKEAQALRKAETIGRRRGWWGADE